MYDLHTPIPSSALDPFTVPIESAGTVPVETGASLKTQGFAIVG